MKISKRYLLILVIIPLILLFGGLMGVRGQKVTAVTAEIGDVEDYYTEDGMLRFGDSYVVISKVSGSVKEVRVEENTQVKKGEVLFIVGDKDYQYENVMHEHNIAGLWVQLEQSKINQLQTASPQEHINLIKGELDAREADYQSVKTIL